MEKHYSFIKNNIVENTLVFAEQNDELAQIICDEKGYDFFIWLNDSSAPMRWSTWDGKKFTPPTDEYLISIGVLSNIPTE